MLSTPQTRSSTANDEGTAHASAAYFGDLKARGLLALHHSRDVRKKHSQHARDKHSKIDYPWVPVAYIVDVAASPGTLEHRYFEDAIALRLELGNPITPAVETRLVLLSYTNPYLDFDLIAAIGVEFGIDPRLFDGNVGYGLGSFLRAYYKNSGIDGQPEPTMPLPSQSVSLELRLHPSVQGSSCGIALSAMLLSSNNSTYKGACPIIIVVRDGTFLVDQENEDVPFLKFDRSWLEKLNAFDYTNQIPKAIQNPIEFVLPYGAIIARRSSQSLQRLTSTYERARDELPGESGSLEERNYPSMMQGSQVLLEDIRFNMRSLSSLHNCPMVRTQGSIAEKSLIADFEYLLQCTLELHEMIKISLTEQVAALSLEASRQSIEESKKVNRFTLVAWVFIPLSLISSIFGMNVKELSPGPSIYLFFAFALPVVAVALVLEWWFVLPSEQRARKSIFELLRQSLQPCFRGKD